MDTFDFTPYGNVNITYEWSTQAVTFEDGTKQCFRQRVHAKKTYNFTISGMDLPRLVKFYNKQKGMEKPFYFTYDGVTEVCYFAAAINPKCKRENGIVMGFSCEVGLEVEKQESVYPLPSTSDMLPRPWGDTDEQYNWNTKVVSIGQVTKRGNKQGTPTRTISGKWCGLKEDRDKLIALFNSHCRMPLKLPYNGGAWSVVFPDKIIVTDHRELKNIVGFECQMELEVIERV